MARRGLRDTLLVAWGLRIVEGVVSTSWRLRRYLLRRVMSSVVSGGRGRHLDVSVPAPHPRRPGRQPAGDDARPQDKIELRQCLDLDQPLPVQFGRFVRSIFDGTMGYSCPRS